MSYDIAFRDQQALDTSALTTILGALHGLLAAIDEMRRAGKNADSDTAIILLARYLGTITNDAGRIVPVRLVGEQHVLDDLGRIPSSADWARTIRAEPWMGRAQRLQQRLAVDAKISQPRFAW